MGRVGRYRSCGDTNNGTLKGDVSTRSVLLFYRGAMCQTSDFLLLGESPGAAGAKTRSPANSFSICYRRYNVPISPVPGST